MLKIGIFFGGPSREREISFAGGRTVYDNLDKTLFEAVPIFVDSLQNLILLDWQFLYKGTIRDFYPPIDFLPPSPNVFQIYVESLKDLSVEEQDAMIAKVGKKLEIKDLPKVIDFAFLALHGYFGEDGQIQGLLDSIKVPYSGSGLRACSIGIDKAFQKKMMEAGAFATPKMKIFSRQDWCENEDEDSNWYDELVAQIGFPMVVRPVNQGSSIGVTIIQENDGNEFADAVNNAFFIKFIDREPWMSMERAEQLIFLRDLTDIRTGIGFPLRIFETDTYFYHPEELLAYLDSFFQEEENEFITLESMNSEQGVIVEEFLKGKEFSCIVMRADDGEVIALPPTEIVKGGEVFDYRSKYLAGLSRKVTPINIPDEQIEAIRHECERLFEFFQFGVYARIDGFLREDGKIFLNDPNTTSGMLPSSFFFHQAAEIGLNPSQFLTYIVRASIKERILENTQLNQYNHFLNSLDEAIEAKSLQADAKKKVAVIMGGYSSERHISVESGRNIYEKLSSSDKYEPIPVFLTGNDQAHEIWRIPINIMLKDNADDIKDKIYAFKKHPIVEKIKQQCRQITAKYGSRNITFEPVQWDYATLRHTCDEVFIALHGRPGEDGTVQSLLEPLKLPYNGSQQHSSQITINKFDTLQILHKQGLTVTDQLLVYKKDFHENIEKVIAQVEKDFHYPLIAKPVDDGCSSAVKVIRNRVQLTAWLASIFRDDEHITDENAHILKLKPKEEFPMKQQALIEAMITKGAAKHFLEVTGGLLTHHEPDGSIRYEMFEPSETLAGGEILSLEEKFLAGEGQNITPARFAAKGDTTAHEYISKQVRADLEKAARSLNVTGYARIDAFVRIYDDNRAETIVIEVNSLPGMTPATCIFHQCAINGYKPFEFIDSILTFGEERVLSAE